MVSFVPSPVTCGHASYDFPYIVSTEVELDSLASRGIKRHTQKNSDGSARTTEGLRCDFMISHPVENDVVLFDVRIVHPVATNAAHFSVNAIWAVQAGYNPKYNQHSLCRSWVEDSISKVFRHQRKTCYERMIRRHVESGLWHIGLTVAGAH